MLMISAWRNYKYTPPERERERGEVTACETARVGVWASLPFHNKGPIKQYLNGVLNIVVHGRTAEISGSFEANEVSADKVQSCWTGAEGRAERP